MKNIKSATNKQIKAFLESQGLYMPSNMLSVGSDAKTIKGQEQNYLTGIVYLIPDYTLCPASKVAACDVACLVSAGRGCFNSVKKGRLNKTAIYKRFPEVFYELIKRDIKKLEKKADKLGLNYCVRLNGTSDIDHSDFIKSMPEVQFYDYTKMSNRKSLPNYHLTFSYSGANPAYTKHIYKALDNGLNIAVVFGDLIDALDSDEWLGLPVINGDDSDLRFLDKQVYNGQAVVALAAKGAAKKDTSGFVVRNDLDLIAVG